MSLRAARGTRDVVAPEIHRWHEVEGQARRTFALYGFEEIRTPIFEDSRVFEKGTGETSEIVQKEMYRFTDLGGHDLTLRPEGTPPVVRAYLEHHLGDSKDVTKLYYIGPMFRYERPQKGRYRQFHQVGVEVFGSESAAVDAEVIDAAMSWLDALAVREKRLLVNSVGDEGCRPAYRETLVLAQRQVLDELCEECARRHHTNPLRVFDCKKKGCQAVVDRLPSVLDHLCDDCRRHFDAVRGFLDAWGVEYEVAPRLVRGLDYYRRTVFEVVSAALGAQDALVGGGRYDGLVTQMGGAEDEPAIGFAAGVERIVMALPERPERPAVDLFLVNVGDEVRAEGLRILRSLRRQGIRCTTDYQGRSMRAQMRAANRSGAPVVLVLGPDEIASGRYTLKRMADGEQRTVAGEELAEATRALGGTAVGEPRNGDAADDEASVAAPAEGDREA